MGVFVGEVVGLDVTWDDVLVLETLETLEMEDVLDVEEDEEMSVTEGAIVVRMLAAGRVKT